MALSNLIDPLPKIWLNANVNSITVDKGLLMENGNIDLNNNDILNVDLLNGIVVADLIGAASPQSIIIYRPGGILPTPPSNIHVLWADVVAKINKANGAIIIFIDDSLESPAPINLSADCQGRVTLISANYNSSTTVNVLIHDGVQLTNLRNVSGPMIINCDSISGPNLVFSNGSNFQSSQNVTYKLTSTSMVSPIQILAGESLSIISNTGGLNLDNSLMSSNYFILLGAGSGLSVLISNQLTYDTTISENIKGPVGSTLFLGADASFDVTNVTESTFLGTFLRFKTDTSFNTFYDDTNTPIFSSDNVQGALNYIKANYLKIVSTSAISCASLTATGNISCVNVNASGNVGCVNVNASGNVSCVEVLQTKYNLFVQNAQAFTQALPDTTLTNVVYNTALTNNNFTFTTGQSVFTIPKSGWYSFTYAVTYLSSEDGGLRILQGCINNDDTLLYGYTCVPATGFTLENFSPTRLNGSFERQMTLGDTFRVQAYQDSGNDITIGGNIGGGTVSLSINRVHD